MISIVIPVYNIKSYIDDCVLSVLSQSYTDWECILVDDGSTDGSGLVCDTYCKNNKNIKVVHQKNSGLAAARNTGIREAKGEYVYFIDGDDKIDSDTLNDFYKILEETGDLDFIIGHMMRFCDGEEPMPFGPVVKNKWVEEKNGKDAFVSIIEHQGEIMMGVRGLYRRKFLLDNDLFFDAECRYSEDQEWTPRIFENAEKIRSCEKANYLYREGRAGSLMNTINPSKIELTLKVYDEWFKRILSNSDDKYYITLYKLMLSRYWSCYFKYPSMINKKDMSKFYDMMDKRKQFAQLAFTRGERSFRLYLIKYIPSRYICMATEIWKKIKE